MSERTKAHSSVLNALQFVAREVMNDSDLPEDRRSITLNELKSIHRWLSELWADEFGYIPPWNNSITQENPGAESATSFRRNFSALGHAKAASRG